METGGDDASYTGRFFI